MAIVPAQRSPLWFLMFLTLAALLTAGVVLTGWKNSGKSPETNVLLSIVGVCSAMALALTLPGMFGARATFVCGSLGLLIGVSQMLSQAYAGPHEGMADLAAVASFLMFGAIGVVLGVMIDLGVWLVRRRR
ncbi:MAG: hypothetical protein JNK56_00265 [Myxococcales bacterium]|nr:hypothetical protein [Myxococcales bacterium]